MKKKERKTMDKEKVKQFIKYFNDNQNDFRELETAFAIYTLYDEPEKLPDEMIYKIDKEVRKKSIIDENIRYNIEDLNEEYLIDTQEEEIER
jgi:hypothetical protein